MKNTRISSASGRNETDYKENNMKTSKIIIKSLYGISEQVIGGESVEITGRKGAGVGWQP